MSGVKLGQTH